MAARMLLRRALLVALLFVLACSGSGAPGDAPADWVLFTNDKAAFDYFVGKGLTNFQAAGIVGNLDQESGMNPGAVQQGGPGRGIAQWSVGGRWDTDSGDNAVAYAKQQGQSVSSLGLQLDFIWYELTKFSGYGLSKLKATTNVTDATVVFQTDFEGCGTCLQSQRITYAKAVLNAYGAIPYGASFVAQSFPFATDTMTMTEGDVVASFIELKNTGTKTWDSNTKIGTTMARDRKSAFADSSWESPSRLDAVQGTVPPGGTYKFKFNLAAPLKPGSYDEHFGVVQEGVAWFGDPGQGGPSDGNLEVKILVVAKEGGVETDSGTKPDAGSTNHDSGTGDSEDAYPTGGCSMSHTRGTSEWPAFALVALAVFARRRRTR
jgi:MYXO-CTERM domain-containing protein